MAISKPLEIMCGIMPSIARIRLWFEPRGRGLMKRRRKGVWESEDFIFDLRRSRDREIY